MKKMIINKKSISPNNKPYIIAEMSANHNGIIDNAYKIISAAKKNGADAIKIQTYTADTLTLNSNKQDFLIESGLWKGQSLYELYESAHTPWDWHKPLFDFAKKENITIFSSPFDNTAIDLLEDLNAPAYKIASFEIIDHQLIKYAASTKKPLIISTGMANEDEIKEAIDIAKSSGCTELAILHCVSGYPSPAQDYNLNTIKDMQQKFDVLIGLSDHTLDNSSAIASVALGACIIEKHFTLDRKGGGPDDSFSMEPKDLKNLVNSSAIAHAALGKIDYKLKSSEGDNIKFRRSLYFVKDLKAGQKISKSDVRSIRPGYGLAPKMINKVIGRHVTQDIQKGTAVNLILLSKD